MVLYPARCRKAGAVLLESRRTTKTLSILTGVLGFLLVIAAIQRELPWIVPILGVMAIIKAVLLFWNPANLLITLKNGYLLRIGDQAFRFFGIVWLVLGTAVASWV